HGEWICFLDSDDLWKPRKLEIQKEFHETNTDLQISQTDEIWIRNGKRVNPMKKHKKYGGDVFLRSLPLCLITPSSVMLRREFFQEIGGFDETFPVCEDYDLWIRITVRYPVGLIENKLVVKYGGHADQLSCALYGMDRFRIKALEKMADSPLLDQNKKRELLKELIRKCIIYAKGGFKHNKGEEAQTYYNKAAQYTDQLKGLV
ncbi:MAG: glycosyltransferase, partial [Candidatus Omnitrophica bacterium]|nr:glycosyltransferase [Candidatus Omnitrophota bacterium]